jgi:hypothetical protein
VIIFTFYPLPGTKSLCRMETTKSRLEIGDFTWGDFAQVRCYQGVATENPINTRDWRENPPAIKRDWLNSRERGVNVRGITGNTTVRITDVCSSSWFTMKHTQFNTSHTLGAVFYLPAFRLYLSASCPYMFTSGVFIRVTTKGTKTLGICVTSRILQSIRNAYSLKGDTRAHQA